MIRVTKKFSSQWMKGAEQEIERVRKIRNIPFSYHRVYEAASKNLKDKDWQELWEDNKTIAWNHKNLKKKLKHRPGGWKHV